MEQAIQNHSYYIIKVHGRGRTYYKIGETNNKHRVPQLLEDYNHLAVIHAEQIGGGILPNNGVKRLNDITLRKYLDKFTAVDNLTMEGLLQTSDGVTEFMNANSMADDAIVSYVDEVVNSLNDEKYFKAKVSKRDIFTIKSADQKHQVKNGLIDSIEEVAGCSLSRVDDKKILLIGQFDTDWVGTFVMDNIVYILHDDAFQKHTYSYHKMNDSIHYLTNTEELFNLNIKFDYIIANPPYAIGNEITRAVIDNVDFDKYINLMPASKYKKGELFKQVSCVESAPDEFEDAAVGDSLTVAVLENNANVYPSYEEFSNNFRDERFVEFYRLNAKVNHYAIDSVNWTRLTEEDHSQLDYQLDFIFGTRECAGNISVKSNCYEFNVKHVDNLVLCYDKTNDISIFANAKMHFNTALEKNNFNRFWYAYDGDNLMNDLKKGLNKTSGTCTPAIPKIDWSKDRDYEHLTLEDIMQILREENPDVAE